MYDHLQSLENDGSSEPAFLFSFLLYLISVRSGQVHPPVGVSVKDSLFVNRHQVGGWHKGWGIVLGSSYANDGSISQCNETVLTPDCVALCWVVSSYANDGSISQCNETVPTPGLCCCMCRLLIVVCHQVRSIHR